MHKQASQPRTPAVRAAAHASGAQVAREKESVLDIIQAEDEGGENIDPNTHTCTDGSQNAPTSTLKGVHRYNPYAQQAAAPTALPAGEADPNHVSPKREAENPFSMLLR
jgi:hypothetical protein